MDISKIAAVDPSKNFLVNATSVKNWNLKVIEARELQTESDLVTALMASAAAPIAFPPVNVPLFSPAGNWGDDTYQDGGLVSNYGISEAVHRGAERIIVLVASVPEVTQVNSILDAFNIVTAAPEYNQLLKEVSFVRKLNDIRGFRKIEVIVILPGKDWHLAALLDFDLKGRDRGELIQEGYNLALAAMKGVA